MELQCPLTRYRRMPVASPIFPRRSLPFRRLTAVFCALVLGTLAVPTAAQQVKPLGFKNLEGAPVGGLILDLETTGRCGVEVADPGEFGNWSGDRREIRVAGGNIPPRGSTQLVLRHNCETITVRGWWWLDPGGSRLGDRKRQRDDADTASFASSFLEEPHLQIITFFTPEGELDLFFPRELLAGETISGSLQLHPGGEGRQRGRNLGQLRQYSLDIGPEDVPGDGRLWTRQLPPEVPSGYLDITLWDAGGVLVSSNVVPIQPAGTLPAATDYRLPFFSQAGEAVRLTGPFDGDTSTTSVTLGGTTLVPVAESPRAFIARTPTSVAGMATVEIREGSITARGTLRNVVLELRSSKNTIASGERLRLEMVVRGLEGITEPLTVTVMNRSIGLAHFLEDPGQVRHVVSPDDIQNGQARFPLELEGSLGGQYDLVPRLVFAE